MFGTKRTPTPAPSPAIGAPDAATVARLGTSLLQTQLVSVDPPGFVLFLNGKHVPSEQVDNVLVSVEAPTTDGGLPSMQAVLSPRPGASGVFQTALFPGAVEITGIGRRVVVVATPDGGVSVRFGLDSEGYSTEVHGLASLSILLSAESAGVHIKWTDGLEEEVFPAV